MEKSTKDFLLDVVNLVDHSTWELVDHWKFFALMQNSETKIFNKKNVLIVFSDWSGDDQNFLLPNPPQKLSERLIQLIQNNPDQKFYIFCGILNLHQIEKTFTNVKIVHWADEMFAINNCHYINTLPQREKNFNSEKHWISLSQNKRLHRSLAAMYLLGQNLDKTGLLKFDPSELLENESWDSYVFYWKFNNREKEILQILAQSSVFKKGFYKVKNFQGYRPNQYRGINDPAIPETKYLSLNQHQDNFEIFLKPLYKNSLIEIINESIFFQEYGLVTEKFLNSVYGFNLPIILSVPGYVKHLRNLGFDMFDSVIDHSYDLISDPIDRLVYALENNKLLLKNAEATKLAWKKCLAGLEHNFQLAQQLERNLESTFKNHLINNKILI